MKSTPFFWLLSVLYAVQLAQGMNYCRMQCGVDHIGCENNGDINELCSNRSEFVDLKMYSKNIVTILNKYRNDVAAGSLKHIGPARRMALMRWDRQLAYLAGLNVKSCVSEHDKCRSTRKFSSPGQSLGTVCGPETMTIQEALPQVFDTWFAESENATADDIKKLTPEAANSIENFATIVMDRNTHVGCAALKIYEDDSVQYLLTCNFAAGSKVGYPVYIPGKPASKCRKSDSELKSLCSRSEKFDPNEVILV